MTYRLSLPVRTKSGDNNHVHWRTKARLAKAHRGGAALAVKAFGVGWQLSKAPLTVTMTRVAPRLLDTDGNASGMKSLRDGVADALGLASDRDPLVTWVYAQRRGKVREYAVELLFEPRIEIDRINRGEGQT